MTTPGKDNARVQAGEVGKPNYIRHLDHSAGSSNEPPRRKAAVFQLPGARRRQVPRCSGCGNPIAAGSGLCEDCTSGAALVARIEDRRAASLRQQSMGNRARTGR